MTTVTISPKFQVVIPSAIRKVFAIRAGQKMLMIPFEGRIELIPDRSIKEMRGCAQGITPFTEREEKDRI